MGYASLMVQVRKKSLMSSKPLYPLRITYWLQGRNRLIWIPHIQCPKREIETTKHYGCSRHLSTWFNQFSILLQRNLEERKPETFNSLRVFQVITCGGTQITGTFKIASAFSSSLPFSGEFFLLSMRCLPFLKNEPFHEGKSFWDVHIVILFYSSGNGRLAYGANPSPTLFLSIACWMTGLKPELSAFAITLLIVLGYVLVSQGRCLALGALIMDAKQASTVVTVTMLAFVLTGGYYVHKVPSFMSWIKYVSTTLYSYRILINVQYGDGAGISTYLGCSSGRQDRATCKFIDEDVRDQIHPAMSVSILMMMFVGYRLLAYIALRRLMA